MFLNHKKQFPYLAIRNDRHVVGKGAIFGVKGVGGGGDP
jgi:hypothetical protein